MEPKTVYKLANECKNIVAIKEASGDFEQALDLINIMPKDFMVISGEDKTALSLTLAGGSGVISVIGQGLPYEFSTLIHFALEKKPTEAFDIFYSLMSGVDLIFEEGNPAGIKAMLNNLKICGLDVRLPLVAASTDLQIKIDNFVKKFKS